MMTGAENLEDAKLAMELGAFSYIGKPVRIDELLTQVSRALRMVEVKKQHLERLAQAERMRDSILSVAAHELRTPINIIMNYVEVLQHQGENGEVRNEALIDMRRTGRRINRLVKRIISLQKRPRSL
jgi:signal transduction histidine kinase